jgi:hypothetical protein
MPIVPVGFGRDDSTGRYANSSSIAALPEIQKTIKDATSQILDVLREGFGAFKSSSNSRNNDLQRRDRSEFRSPFMMLHDDLNEIKASLKRELSVLEAGFIRITNEKREVNPQESMLQPLYDFGEASAMNKISALFVPISKLGEFLSTESKGLKVQVTNWEELQLVDKAGNVTQGRKTPDEYIGFFSLVKQITGLSVLLPVLGASVKATAFSFGVLGSLIGKLGYLMGVGSGVKSKKLGGAEAAPKTPAEEEIAKSLNLLLAATVRDNETQQSILNTISLTLDAIQQLLTPQGRGELAEFFDEEEGAATTVNDTALHTTPITEFLIKMFNAIVDIL